MFHWWSGLNQYSEVVSGDKQIDLSEVFTADDFLSLLISGLVCDRQIEVHDYFLGQTDLVFSGTQSIDITDSFSFNDLLALLATEGKSITIAETFHSIETTPLDKFLELADQFNAEDFLGRIIPILETLTASESIGLDRLLQILDSTNFTDKLILQVLVGIEDSAQFEDLFNTIMGLKDSITFTDVVGLFQDRSKTDVARFGETIMIKRTLDTEPDYQAPDDIAQIIKEKIVQVRNPKRVSSQ
jgi:hypothetical protein